MGSMDAGIGREPQYDVFAEEFLDHAQGGFYNAYYDRPACLALLGDVAGKRVLDAACGPGLYAAELVRRGAQVVGFDHSPRMVQLCRARVSQGEFRVHDLGDPIGWLPDASVDLALCALAIEYVDDRVAALSELRRVLRPDGALVLSRLHPTGDWLRHGVAISTSGPSRRPGARAGRYGTGWRRWSGPARKSSRPGSSSSGWQNRARCPRPLPSTLLSMNGWPASPGDSSPSGSGRMRA
jgi:SAM-dependent methyltransferase